MGLDPGSVSRPRFWTSSTASRPPFTRRRDQRTRGQGQRADPDPRRMIERRVVPLITPRRHGMTPTNRNPAQERRGPAAIGSIVKRYRKRDGQHTYGLRIRAYGERHWVALGTEREGWNDVRAADRRDETTALIRRGVWRPPNTFELDPREKNPGFHEFASDWLKRYRRTVGRIHRRHGRVHAQPPSAAVPAHLSAR